MAILAGSRGGRLVASGITVAGDRDGCGFNVKVARAAAREAERIAAAEDACERGVRGSGGKVRVSIISTNRLLTSSAHDFQSSSVSGALHFYTTVRNYTCEQQKRPYFSCCSFHVLLSHQRQHRQDERSMLNQT